MLRTDFRNLSRKPSGLAFQALFVLAALLCSAVTLFVLARSSPTSEAPAVVYTLLVINGVILAIMAWSVASRYLSVRRQSGQDGGRLTRRFMLLFAVSAMIPALVVSLFLWATISRGIDTWFGDRVLTIVEETAAVARESLIEFEETFEEDTRNVATDINNAALGLETDRTRFEEYLGIQGYVRNMTGAFVVDDSGQILASGTNLGPSAAFPNPGLRDLVDAKEGEIVVTTYQGQGVVTSLKQLDAIDNAFLYVVKPFDTQILKRLEVAQAGLTDYRLAKERSSQTKLLFVFTYLQIVALVLILSVRLAQSAAMKISEPISDLAVAARNVTKGKQGVRVQTIATGDEVEDLSKSFNLMTATLDERREDLIRSREESDERRVFVETLLTEMSSGVIRLDPSGNVTLANRSAEKLLGTAFSEDTPLDRFAPDLGPLIHDSTGQESVSDLSVNISKDGETKNIRIKIGPDGAGGRVMTLDDATRLISAQRQLAWRDVARRVAHEIRNPLTPIQLSAERLKRRYSDKIEDDKGVFDRCVSTILRQVEDIGRMVGEFSDFARMPKPNPTLCELESILADVVFAQQVVTPDINIQMHPSQSDLKLLADERLLSQAFGNLIKNAAEAINERGPENETPGEIQITLEKDGSSHLVASIQDNGTGFPEELRDNLLEPYVTKKEGGTGLGLAIVNRIIMDHGGALQLLEPEGQSQGALVRITLPAWMSDVSDDENVTARPKLESLT